MGNKKFEDKIRILEEDSGLHINRQFNIFDSWGIKEILERAEWLYERFIQLESFKDLDASYRSLAKEVITLNSDWNFLRPFSITFPDESSKKVSSIREIAHSVIEWILANYAIEFVEFISRDCPKCISAEAKDFAESANIVEYNFGDFMFYSPASGRDIQANIQKIVEGIGLDLDDFEIDGIYRR